MSTSDDLVFREIDYVKVPTFPPHVVAQIPVRTSASTHGRDYGRYCARLKEIQKQQLSENISSDPLFRILQQYHA